MVITYGSVCSGIESASVAWEPLGMKPLWFSEIEPFPCKVLDHHWPTVPNLGDMTVIPDAIRMGLFEAPDVLVGGTPCQAFSVAGKQMSLDDARGQLTLVYGDLLNAIDEVRPYLPAVAVWENVPGVLSTKDNAFGWFLGLLAGEFTLDDCLSGTAQPLEAQPGESRQKWPKSGCVIGPRRTVAWRVLDAQYFGVAQRRRRVFVVASSRKGFDPAEVLFEREGVRRDIAPSREARQETASAAGVGSHWDNPANPHPALSQSHNSGGIGASNQEVFSQRGAGLCMAVHGTQDPDVKHDLAHTLGRNNGQENALCYGTPGNWIGRAPENGGNAVEPMHNISPCLTSTDRHGVSEPFIGFRMTAFGEYADDETAITMKARDYKDATDLVVSTPPRVRRLTPTECERLQGFPDGHTAIPGAADGNRYKALGNSKAVPVVQWIGVRILCHLL